jgi:hypothetical protein
LEFFWEQLSTAGGDYFVFIAQKRAALSSSCLHLGGDIYILEIDFHKRLFFSFFAEDADGCSDGD